MVEDRERDTWKDWCNSAFLRNGYGAFPPDTEDPLPTVLFSDKLFSDEDIADMPVLDNEEMPVSALQVFADEGVSLVPPDIDWIVRMNNNETAFLDKRMGEVLVLSMEICDPPIHSDTLDVRISYGAMEWLCLLYSASSGSAGANTVAIRLDSKGLDHWRGVIWNPDIVGRQCLHVCYDCLCLMALFRDVMLLVHDWVAWSMWTGIESGYCRTITWELGYLGSINPPCDADRLCGHNEWQIKELEVMGMPGGSDNNRCVRDCAGGPFRGKDYDHGDWTV